MTFYYCISYRSNYELIRMNIIKVLIFSMSEIRLVLSALPLYMLRIA